LGQTKYFDPEKILDPYQTHLNKPFNVFRITKDRHTLGDFSKATNSHCTSRSLVM